jgi:acyl-CoA hydrolase
MQSCASEYKSKLVTAAEAVKVVKSGDWVEHAFGVGGANELDQALAQRVNELYDVKVRVDIGVWPHYSLDADPTGEHFTWQSWHLADWIASTTMKDSFTIIL